MVRYAVANTPYFCTLFNSHSLPKATISFRNPTISSTIAPRRGFCCRLPPEETIACTARTAASALLSAIKS